jgi:endonuclease VIII
MAEGDTILRLARRLDSALGGETVRAAAPNPRGRAAGVQRLDGRRLERAQARGKHLLLHFDGDLVLHSHLGMSGGWHLYAPGARWRRSRAAAWAVLGGGGQEAVQFGGPTLRLLPAARARRDPELARLGPDLLAEDFEPAAALAGLRADPGRGLGEALLDQTAVAGIGNIFKSEACFAARLDPWRPVGELGDEELAAVLLTARERMLAAVAANGRKRFSVYRRPGPCPACGGPVSARGQGDANRATYWCPRCQR